MSTTSKRGPARSRARAADQRLARLLDTSSLARAVPHLAPETLHRLIRHCGLDACGEVLTSATPAQLSALVDLDLWRQERPGRDDAFDVDRFGDWLEVLVDAGESTAARTFTALDPHVVVAGLSRYVRIFDPGTFEPTAPSDDETQDRREMMHSETSHHVLECEIGGYLVRARRTDAWDAIVTLLATLETDHTAHFHAVMQGCRALSNSRPEIDGLDDLLTTSEQQLHDVAIEREQRRSRRGYATPADARAFLQTARRSTAPTGTHTNHPIVDAYFRATEPVFAAAGDAPAWIGVVIDVLAEAGVMPMQPRALLASPNADPRSPRLPLLRRLMEFLLHHDETTYLTRNRELAFLANTLQAGCSVQSRPLTTQEASDAAACVCNLGLECWPAAIVDAFLVDHDLVAIFERGWSTLHRDVSVFVADQLLSIVTALPCVDADTVRGLRALERQLTIHRAAGTVWLARDAADVLATLDMTAWIGVLGLLDECPIVPAALTAVLERRTTSVSPLAFEFISTTGQIGDIRVFMRALPHLLSG